VQLTFTAKGTDVNVQNVDIMATGGILTDIASFSVVKDTTVVRMVNLDTSGIAPGTLINVDLESVEADRTVRITGRETRMYVDSCPSNITIDGLFNDWSGGLPKISSDIDTGGIDENVDIERYSSAKDTENAYFYLDVAGDTFGGTFLPKAFRVPPPLGPPGVPGPAPTPTVVHHPRISGEDVTRVYIDANSSDTSGNGIEGILADRMIEIKGIHGSITSKKAYEWIWPDWVEVSVDPDVEIDDTQMELGIPIGILGELNATNVIFHTTDWRGSSDSSEIHWGLDPGAEATKGGNPGIIPLHGNNAQTAYSQRITNTPTVDGNCSTSATEYNGAYTITSFEYTVYIGHAPYNIVFPPGNMLFVCIIADFDDMETLGDYATIYFDTDHGGEALPQDEDRNFTLGRNMVGFSFVQRQGNNNVGTPWKGCSDCNPSDAGMAADRGPAIHYEFQINFTDVWGTSLPSPNQVAGFEIVMYDNGAGIMYIWGSLNFDGDAPNTWGHLQYLPEFHDMLIPIAAVVVISMVFLRRRRSRRPQEE
jgi:hypothetical protein